MNGDISANVNDNIFEIVMTMWKDDEISFVMTAGVDGAGTDNMYQNTIWGYIEQIVLRVVDTIIPASYEASIKDKITKEYLETFPEYKDSFGIYYCNTADGVNLGKVKVKK